MRRALATAAPGETRDREASPAPGASPSCARQAGCYQAFVGIESLNPDNLNFATKYQNTDDRQHKMKLEESRARVIDKYRRVVDNWHQVGISVHAGYMLGFPSDGPDCGPRRGGDAQEDWLRYRLVLHHHFASRHRGPGALRQGRRYHRLGLQPARFPARDAQASEARQRRLDAGVSRRVQGLLFDSEDAPHDLHRRGRTRPCAGIAPINVAPVHVLLFLVPAGTSSDGRRHLADPRAATCAASP